jgi:hypothetical protein
MRYKGPALCRPRGGALPGVPNETTAAAAFTFASQSRGSRVVAETSMEEDT